jgi:polyadenylate-binding protein
LAWETTTATLQATFEQFGPILEAAVITDPSGKSKGFGFVTFQTAEGARVSLLTVNFPVLEVFSSVSKI